MKVLLSIGHVENGRAQLVRVEPVTVPVDCGDPLQTAHKLIGPRLNLNETVLDGQVTAFAE